MSGAHTWQIVAEPAVPGLGYSLDARILGAVGSRRLRRDGAVVAAGGRGFGRQADRQSRSRAVAPSGVELHIQHALPAGVQVDTPSLEALVAADTITRFEVSAGFVDLYVDELDPGQTVCGQLPRDPDAGGHVCTARPR